MRMRLEITTKFEEGKKCAILTSWVRGLKKPNTICHPESNTKYITYSIRKNNQNKGPESKLLETAIEKIIDFSHRRGGQNRKCNEVAEDTEDTWLIVNKRKRTYCLDLRQDCTRRWKLSQIRELQVPNA